MEYQEIYRKSLAEADAAGEREKFLESHRLNVECRKAIEKAVGGCFDGRHLDDACVGKVLGEYGPERVGWVLANTVGRKEWDGRFSQRSKEWAREAAVPASVQIGADLRDEFVVESHPAVLDGFINLYREETERNARQKEKPSIREQLEEKPRGNLCPGNREDVREKREEAR